MDEMIQTFTAGADIKVGQVLYAEMSDEDTSEPLTLVYPMVPGKTHIGIALSNAKAWEQVTVGMKGQIGDITTVTAIAGEKLRGGVVYLGKDGKLYNSKPQSIIRYVIAGAAVKKGQGLLFDREAGGYVPTDAEKVEGTAAADMHKGGLFPMIVAYYDADTDTLSWPPHPLDE
jgi:hypothetical protein